MPDPRTMKDYLMKVMFFGNKEAYQDFVALYDEAVASGSAMPDVVAKINLRKVWKWHPNTGDWTRKIPKQPSLDKPS